MKSITMLNYEIIMEDEQYNDILNRAQKMYRENLPYDIKDYLINEIFEDIQEYLRREHFIA